MSVNAAQVINSAQSSSTSQTPSSSSSSLTSTLNSTQNEFYQLLTTEMQNQDPSNPVDSSTMMQEIGELVNLQSQTATDSALQNLTTLLTNSQLNSAVSYIGTSITASGNSTILSNGAAEMTYTLPTQAASATVTVMDSSGNVVSSGPGNTASGQNVVYWNGTNSATGATEPNGTYTFQVTATDASGAPITPTTDTSGIVTSVVIQNGSPVLMIGDTAVPLANVTSVGQNPFVAASTGTSGTGG